MLFPSLPYLYLSYILLINPLLQDIFPPPSEPVENPSITVEELFGGRYPIGLNPQTLFPLSLIRLRVLAGQMIRKQGYLPKAGSATWVP